MWWREIPWINQIFAYSCGCRRTKKRALRVGVLVVTAVGGVGALGLGYAAGGTEGLTG